MRLSFKVNEGCGLILNFVQPVGLAAKVCKTELGAKTTGGGGWWQQSWQKKAPAAAGA
jgi:hypothetical protein